MPNRLLAAAVVLFKFQSTREGITKYKNKTATDNIVMIPTDKKWKAYNHLFILFRNLIVHQKEIMDKVNKDKRTGNLLE